MSNPSDTMKKREKAQQQEKTYNQNVHGMDTELGKRAESEREHSSKRPSIGE